VYYGNGGFIYSEVYNMPIHIRRYHIRKIDTLHKKHIEENEKLTQQSTSISSTIPKMPNISKT